MDLGLLTSEELMHLQNLARRLQHFPPAAPASAPSDAAPLQGSQQRSTDQSQSPAHRASQPTTYQAAPLVMGGLSQPFSASSQPFSASSQHFSASSQPISTYQSVRAPVTVNSAGPLIMGSSQGHPSTSLSASAAPSQPFLGFNSLGVSMTGQVNRQRLSAAAAHIPRQPRLPSRGRRRGPAIHPPGMPRAPRIDDCYTAVSVNGTSVPGIRTVVKVYPPQEFPSEHFFVYRFHRDSFNSALQFWYLTYSQDLPLSTTVADLISLITDQMQSSPYHYQFTTNPSTTSFLVHEVLPLQLLELVNRGVPRNTDSQVRLRRATHAQLTLGNLAQSKLRFAVPSIAIEGNAFVVHLAVRVYPLLATAALSDADTAPRVHSCVSRKIYSVFGLDGATSNVENNGSDTSDSGDEDPSANLAQPTAVIQPRHSSRLGQPQAGPSAMNRSQSPTRSFGSSTRGLQRDASLSSFSFLPPRIWDTTWVPTVSHYHEFFSAQQMAETLYELASQGATSNSLEVRAQDVAGLALSFKEMIGQAVDAGDFTNILAPERTFFIISPSSQGHGTIRSLGEGIEREVIHTLFEGFRANPSQWFNPRADGYSTLATTHTMSTARHIPSSRLRSLSILGAITALSLLCGMSTVPWDPVFLHFLVHECDIASIHPGILSEWHPELKRTISEWLEVGPHANIIRFQDHFATYHDLQVACLQDRDDASHAALAGEMLYRSVIGTEPPNHPEIRAFMRGLQLQCRNGLTFFDFVKSWDGGSEQFFTLIWSLHISSYETLEPQLRITSPPVPFQEQLDTLLANNDDRMTFPFLLRRFLQGSGIPSPELFASARDHFNAIIDLDAVEDSGFRARMFCWAATGSCERAAATAPISVHFVNDDDHRYGNNNIRSAMIREGKINFQTCFSKVFIPASYIIHIASQHSYSGADMTYFLRAVDHWLLCEVLNAIGNHTIA